VRAVGSERLHRPEARRMRLDARCCNVGPMGRSRLQPRSSSRRPAPTQGKHVNTSCGSAAKKRVGRDSDELMRKARTRQSCGEERGA
jgi:hypothetical protein